MSPTENPVGIAPATIKSASFQGTYSSSRFPVRIVSVTAPGDVEAGVHRRHTTVAGGRPATVTLVVK